MILVAALVVRNELGRYLQPCIDHLLEFCDKIVVLDDASDDGTTEWLLGETDKRVQTISQREPRFDVHEGRTRQALLQYTLSVGPTHVLSIDADELVADGASLRTLIGRDTTHDVWKLHMEEVWKATPDALFIREDGGWRAHGVPVLWRAPRNAADPNWQIMDRKLACKRVPMHVTFDANWTAAGISILHLGWANEGERRARYDRYMRIDGGRFHARRHLDSIMWPDARVRLRRREWPTGAVFDAVRAACQTAAA